jgi:hypothetical protein
MMNLKRSKRKSTRVASPCPDGFRGIDPFLLQRDDAVTISPASAAAAFPIIKNDSKARQ